MAVARLTGARIQRREDPRLIPGHGRYVDDVDHHAALHMAVVRSPYAHAAITGLDAARALGLPGVEAVYTAAEFATVLQGSLPVGEAGVKDKLQVPAQFPVASREVVYQGQPVAVVLAADRYRAADAAAAVA